MEIERPAQAANAFTDMASRITLNAKQGFGGAFVIVPPATGGEPVETLILDNKQDAATFWSLLKTRCDIAIAELQQREHEKNQSFGGRR